MAEASADPDLSALTAVVAHGLLNAIAVSSGAISTLRRFWPNLSEEDRNRMLGQAEASLALVVDVLTDLVRGLPEESQALLDSLRTPPS